MKGNLIFSLAVLFVLVTIPVHTQGLEPPVPPAPSSGNYVLDELAWLTSAQEDEINTIIRGLDQDGVAEIAVVTRDDCGSDKLAYRKSLFDNWGIGHANDNDGLLILVCWYGGDASRRSVEQLYGRGLNGLLTSRKTDGVAQTNFVPSFQQGKPGDGLVKMVRSYNTLLRTPPSTGNSSNPIVRFVENLNEETKFGALMFLFVAVLLVLNRFLPRPVREWIKDWTRSGGNDRNDRDSFGGGRSDGGGGSSTRF